MFSVRGGNRIFYLSSQNHLFFMKNYSILFLLVFCNFLNLSAMISLIRWPLLKDGSLKIQSCEILFLTKPIATSAIGLVWTKRITLASHPNPSTSPRGTETIQNVWNKLNFDNSCLSNNLKHVDICTLKRPIQSGI